VLLSQAGLELLIKLITAALLAAISDDKQRLIDTFKLLSATLDDIMCSLNAEVQSAPQHSDDASNVINIVDPLNKRIAELESKLADSTLSVDQKTVLLSNIVKLKKQRDYILSQEDA